MAESANESEYVFDLSRYQEAVETQRLRLAEANEAQERLEEADTALRIIEDQLDGAFGEAKAATRLRAYEASGG